MPVTYHITMRDIKSRTAVCGFMNTLPRSIDSGISLHLNHLKILSFISNCLYFLMRGPP